MEITRGRPRISISQRKNILDMLQEIGMLRCRPTNTPMEPNHKLGLEEDVISVDRE